MCCRWIAAHSLYWIIYLFAVMSVFKLSSNIKLGPSTHDIYLQMLNEERETQEVTSRIVGCVVMLQWHFVVIFYDHSTENHFLTAAQLLEDSTKAVLIMSYKLTQDMPENIPVLLITIYGHHQGDLNFILLCNSSNTAEVLSQVNSIDMNSNKRTEYRHHSKWIVFVNGRHNLSLFAQRIQNLENVLAVRWDNVKGSKKKTHCNEDPSIVLSTLAILQEGRVFVRLPRVISKESNTMDIMFPNIKYGYNNRTLVVAQRSTKIMRSSTAPITYQLDYFITKQIALALNFSLQLVEPPDGEWGRLKDGKWTGLIGMLNRREVDLVMNSLSPTPMRSKVAQFIQPPTDYYSLKGLFVKEVVNSTGLSIYLRPFSLHLVLLVLLSTIVCSSIAACLYIPSFVNTDHYGFWSIIGNQIFTFLGALLHQGQARPPRQCSVRCLLAFWWMFAIVIMTSYSGNLTAFLTVQKEHLPFSSLEELLQNNDYTFGIDVSTASANVMKRSEKGQIFRRTWERMVTFNWTDPSILSSDDNKQMARVDHGMSVLFETSTNIDRIVWRDCRYTSIELTEIGRKYLCLGVPIGSPLIQDISSVLYRLQRGGLIDYLKKKTKGEKCGKLENKATGIRWNQMMGLFYIVAAGLLLCVIVLCIEIAVHRFKTLSK